MNYDEDLITPAQHTKYRDTVGVHHAPSRTRTVLFENFNADDDSEHEAHDIDQDKTDDIGHHGRSQPRSDSPYNSSRSPSNSNDPSHTSNFAALWEDDNNEKFLSGIMDTSCIGPVGAAHTLNAALHHIFNVDVIPVTRDLGPSLLDPKKNNRMAESISAATSYLSKTRPDIITAITGITHTTGTAANEQLLLASNLFFAHGKTHRVLMHAVMIYLWTHHEQSHIRAQAESIIFDYVLAQTPSEVTALISACSEGCTSNLTFSPSSVKSVGDLPGIRRLTLKPSMDHHSLKSSVDNWHDLFKAFTKFLCKEDFSTPRISDLDNLLFQFDLGKGGTASPEDILATPFCQPGFTIQKCHSELHKAFHKIAIAAHHAHQPSRTPDDDMQKKNLSLIVRYAHPRVWERFLTLLDTNTIPIDSMPYNDFAQWIFKAERPPSARSAIIAFVNSISTNSPPSPTLPTDKDTDKDKDKDKDKSHHWPEPVYMEQGSGSFKFMYEGLTGPGVFASPTIRNKAHYEGNCSSCLNYKNKKYPQHTDNSCPFTMPDCVPRTYDHTPVIPVHGTRYKRESALTRIQQFLDERRTSLKQGSTPQITVQPMQVKTEDASTFITTDEPPHVPPTLPPSPWSHPTKVGMGWCDIIPGHGSG